MGASNSLYLVHAYGLRSPDSSLMWKTKRQTDAFEDDSTLTNISLYRAKIFNPRVMQGEPFIPNSRCLLWYERVGVSHFRLFGGVGERKCKQHVRMEITSKDKIYIKKKPKCSSDQIAIIVSILSGKWNVYTFIY